MSFPWTFRLKEASNLLFCPGLGRSAEWRPRSAAMPAKWRVWKHNIEDMHVIIKVWHIHEEIEQNFFYCKAEYAMRASIANLYQQEIL
jgi:hypothetical protein